MYGARDTDSSVGFVKENPDGFYHPRVLQTGLFVFEKHPKAALPDQYWTGELLRLQFYSLFTKTGAHTFNDPGFVPILWHVTNSRSL